MFDKFTATVAYKTAFRAFSYLRMRNLAVYISTLFSTANHSSLESQVELTGMLSSREQIPFPYSSFKYHAKKRGYNFFIWLAIAKGHMPFLNF